MKNVYFIIVAILIIIYIVNTVKRNKFSIEESFFWVLGSFIALVLAIFPTIFDNVAKWIGIDYSPSLFFLLCIIFLLLINFRNSKKIAIQQEKITELAELIAILDNKKDRNE